MSGLARRRRGDGGDDDEGESSQKTDSGARRRGYACRTPFDCTLLHRVRHTAEGENSSLPSCGPGVGIFYERMV